MGEIYVFEELNIWKNYSGIFKFSGIFEDKSNFVYPDHKLTFKLFNTDHELPWIIFVKHMVSRMMERDFMSLGPKNFVTVDFGKRFQGNILIMLHQPKPQK